VERAEYLDVLKRLHELLRPRSYLEIGTLSGRSLELAQCPTIAVDPHFAFDRNVLTGKPICLLFQMTSDEFFSQFKPRALLGRAIDMAFLDGMHLAEFVLRDFIQVERNAKRNSLILLHDCLPGDVDMTSRVHRPGTAWTGDVWKILPVLMQYRPDIRINVLDSPPTGLTICTNLNPESKVLTEMYADIVDEMSSMVLTEEGLLELRERIGVTGTESTRTLEALSQRYWL
jgi:hypothetical protein